MITLISPAKTLDLSTPNFESYSYPDFQKETMELVSIMKRKSVDDLKKLMDISDNLAELNKKRYSDFQKIFDSQNSKQALLAFQGILTHIDVEEFSEEEFSFAQNHLGCWSLWVIDITRPYAAFPLNNYKTSEEKSI